MTQKYVTSADGLTVVPKPDPEYLALFGTSGLTASIGLSEGSHLASGEKVLITAAAGGVGHIAAQWALLKGCHVIATTSNDKKQEFLKELGCHRVINYKTENLDQVLNTEYPVIYCNQKVFNYVLNNSFCGLLVGN